MNLDQLTAENYSVPVGEERAYHCVIEVKQFDPKTGRRISAPRLQKFGRKAFESYLLTSLRQQGYEIRIVHDPREWEKAHAEKKAEIARQKEAARAEAAKREAEQKEAELQARIEAEVKARVEAAIKKLEKPATESKPKSKTAKKPENSTETEATE